VAMTKGCVMLLPAPPPRPSPFHINHALLWIEAGFLGLGLLVLECNVGVVSQMRRSAYFLV